MSHFAILVIGDDPDKQLAPYHEFECTGRVDEYVQSIDIKDEFLDQLLRYKDEIDPLKETLEYYGYENSVVESEEDIDIYGEHKFGYAVIKDGVIEKVAKRTNPNAKWDWYSVGGRWTGFLKLKRGFKGITGKSGVFGNVAPKGYADQTTKGAVDWEGMRDEAGKKAAKQWDDVKKLCPNFWESWKTILERNANDVDAARKEYHAQDGKKAIWNSTNNDLKWTDDDILVSREQYIQTARDKACCLFGVLKDGQWIERGEMGWFGCVSNETDKQDWYARFSQEIDSLPDDTLLTVIDCHI